MVMVKGSDFTLIYTHGMGSAVLFDADGQRIDCGDSDEVSERLIERLGVTVDYVDTDALFPHKNERGWGQVVKTLDEIKW